MKKLQNDTIADVNSKKQSVYVSKNGNNDPGTDRKRNKAKNIQNEKAAKR